MDNSKGGSALTLGDNKSSWKPENANQTHTPKRMDATLSTERSMATKPHSTRTPWGGALGVWT
eukprot:2113028-Alexandrium_andersonii.AAC.1